MFSLGELHPGVSLAVRRLSMDELGIARAMAAGELTSPQRYENVWLFDIRITGTMTAYRPAIEKSDETPGRDAEYAYRPPEHYLNDEFLARCNGLPVIAYHPQKKLIMDGETFKQQTEGTVFLPYIKGDEVWGIAKIYDDETATWMVEEQLSTSPAVVFRNPDANTKLTLESGDTLLIEGKPSLLDHIAICEHGVWDKGGEPTGVRADSIETDTHHQGSKDMSDIKKADADASDTKTDSSDNKVLAAVDAIMGRLDSISARMDSFEESKAKADAADEEKAKADAAEEAEKKADSDEDKKADSDDKDKDAKADASEDDEKKADASEEDKDAKADSVPRSEFDALKAKLDSLDARVKPMSEADREALNATQARADSAFSMHGKRAPRPLDGEAHMTYRRRLLREMQPHSALWAKADLSSIISADALAIVETQIYADSVKAAMNPVDLPVGELREIVQVDSTGRRITTFAGEPGAWMQNFQPPSRRFMTGITKGA